MDTNLNGLLNKINMDHATLNPLFFDTLKIVHSNFIEVPTFFPRLIRKHLVDGKLNQEQFLSALAMHYMCFGNFTYNLTMKVINQIKEKFNYDKLLDQIRSNQDEQQTLNLIKAARIVSKLQNRVKDDMKDNPNFIGLEQMTEIVNLVMPRVEKNLEQERYVQVLYWLAAVSDYPNTCFKYENEEPKINKIIREAIKGTSIRGAYPPFLHIMAAESTQSSKKLALKLMREFGNNYAEEFPNVSTIQFVNIFSKYAEHNWMMAETYNYLIEGLAKKFEEFTPKELASICSSLAKVGLRQDDILNQSVLRVNELATRQDSFIRTTFNRLIVPMFRAYVDLNLHNEENSEFKKLYDDEYVS